MSVNFVSSGHPRSMLGMLEERNLIIKQHTPAPGFYAVKGWVFPIQVVVLDELVDPQKNYMFAAFFTRRGNLKSEASALLVKKYVEDPSDRELKQLVDFVFENDLVHEEDIEEVLSMTREMTVEEKKRIQIRPRQPDSGLLRYW